VPSYNQPLPIVSTDTSPSGNAIMPIENGVAEEIVQNSIMPQVNAVSTSTNTVTPTPTPTGESFWDKNKSWLKPVAIGAGGIGLIAIGLSVMKPTAQQSRSQPSKGLSGVPQKRKKKSNQRKTKGPKPHKKTAVALL
jgi:hypothetical protein